jgi:hypothetical protein
MKKPTARWIGVVAAAAALAVGCGKSGTSSTTGTGGTGGDSGAAGTGGAAGTACLETNPPAEIAATCQACLDASADPASDGCCAIVDIDPTGFTLCQEASACMRMGNASATKCNLEGDVTTCYCGTNQATCDVAGMPNGPCVGAMTEAAGRNVKTHTTDAPIEAQVIERLGDPAYALGRAVDIHGIAGVYCPSECGL